MERVLPCLKRMTFLFMFIFLFLVSIQLNELNAQTTKVLFIGSSLTASNNQPTMFAELSQAAGKNIFVENGARAGHNLTDHLYVNETLEKLNQEEWDYVILENGDYGLMYNEYKDDVWVTVDTYIDIILNNNSATKIIFFLDWAMKNGVTQSGIYYTYESYQQKIYDATLEIANSKNMIVAPIGSAWREIVGSGSELELYALDNAHPSLLGSYLGACVYYSVIFGEAVAGNSYRNTIPEVDALYLQSVASSTVLDNLELWNLVTSVEDDIDDIMMNTSFTLYQNYPNPFNPSTTIQFELSERSVVDLEIFNSLGERINVLIDKRELSPGMHIRQWNGRDNNRNRLSSGIYFYTLRTGKSAETKSMTLLK